MNVKTFLVGDCAPRAVISVHTAVTEHMYNDRVNCLAQHLNNLSLSGAVVWSISQQ